MLSSSHQPVHFFATAKTHKFGNINDITIDNLKLRPIIDKIGTCYYKKRKGIADYLKPLRKKNEFVTTNIQQFPSMLNKLPLFEDQKDISYDAESLFTNIPIKETINFIGNKVYNHKKLNPVCK